MKKVIYILFSVVLLSSGCSVFKKTAKPTDELVTLKTSYGEIQIILFDDCPLHKENFLKLAKEGFYDGTTFHRVMDNFMIQGGDPLSKDNNTTNDGTGGPGYTIPHEISQNHKHVYGALAAARLPNAEKRSSGSQFYIVENIKGVAFLDGQYTVYGQVIKGLTIVELIAVAPKDGRDRPKKNITMTVTVETLTKEEITKLTGYIYETK